MKAYRLSNEIDTFNKSNYNNLIAEEKDVVS